MRDIARLDEPTMYALGFDRVTVNAFQHILTAVGKVVDAPTLPETVAIAATTTDNVADLDADRSEGVGQDNATARKFADIAAELMRDHASLALVLRRLDDIAADMESVALANKTLSRRIAELENGVN